MNFTVLNVAYPFVSVGHDAVGCAEQVLAHLDAALVREGHESLVLAGQGSQVQGVQFTFSLPPGDQSPESRSSAQRRYRAAIHETLRRWRVDLIHLHGVDFWAYLPEPGTPVLATLHSSPAVYPEGVFSTPRRQTFLNCVSLSQKNVCPESANLVATIENGVDLEFFTPGGRKGDFALAMGKIGPEEGYHRAVAAAARADCPMVLAGRVSSYPQHQRYFEQFILPNLNESRRFVGPVDRRHRRELLTAARCVLISGTVAEAGSLVAMEALACGTPVIASAAGALPDIIDDGRTGFLVSDEREMAEAIGAAGRIDPRHCRDAAERRFDIRITCRKYLDLYESILTGQAVEHMAQPAPRHSPAAVLEPCTSPAR